MFTLAAISTRHGTSRPKPHFRGRRLETGLPFACDVPTPRYERPANRGRPHYRGLHCSCTGARWPLCRAPSNGRTGLQRAYDPRFKLLVVDRMLPELDGLSIVRRVRRDGILTSVLFLSTLAELDDRVTGLDAGGDDYLTKPFAAVELIARQRARSAIAFQLQDHIAGRRC